MKDMSILINKKIINKETHEIRRVVEIDEINRKIIFVPDNDPASKPAYMAAASYDRRWTLYEEPAISVSDAPIKNNEDTASEIAPSDEPMKMSETVKALEDIFDKLNAIYFKGKLPKPVITVQTTPKAYGHCSTKKIWKSASESMYEINLGAEYINRPKEQTCCTLLHEMVHLFCNETGIRDTCQNGRYHNKVFAQQCEARDLAVEYDRANGHAYTSPTDTFKQKISDAGIDLSVRFAHIMPKIKETPSRNKAHRYVCLICGQEVRSTSELSLICGHCEVPMDRAE